MFWNKKGTKSPKKRQLVIITGCAGSGKTTIGKTLAQKLGYCYIDKDTVTRSLQISFWKGAGLPKAIGNHSYIEVRYCPSNIV